MSDASAFTKLVPGFDFLQGLVKNAGAALPGIGQWVAPTLNPEELEKRIEELRTVQFWLEQNARMIGATIQALEVQRMTLSTLKTMNVQMGDLRDALKIRVPEPKAEPKPAPAPMFAPAKAEAPEPVAGAESKTEPEALGAKPGAVDPMQWWGALTKQFTELATAAMKDSAAAAAAATSPNANAKAPDDAPDSTPAQATSASTSSSARVARKAAPAAARKKPAAR